MKVKREGLPVAELGDSDNLRVGQRVYAIGNPFGLAGGPTITSGVISSLNRTIESKRGLPENLVQPDAPDVPETAGDYPEWWMKLATELYKEEGKAKHQKIQRD